MSVDIVEDSQKIGLWDLVVVAAYFMLILAVGVYVSDL